MLVMVALISFNVGAAEVYSCSFDKRVNYGFGGELDSITSQSVKLSKEGGVEIYTYVIDMDKAYVKSNMDKIKATFLKTGYESSYNGWVNNVIFVEKSGRFPSTTTISNGLAVRSSLHPELAFKGVTSFTSYGSCIKTIL